MDNNRRTLAVCLSLGFDKDSLGWSFCPTRWTGLGTAPLAPALSVRRKCAFCPIIMSSLVLKKVSKKYNNENEAI